MDLKELINNFWDYQKKNNIELYNEFSFQHELGIYLRNNLPNYKIQFERNISYFFNNVKDTKKKEIDIVIFKDDFSEKYAAIKIHFGELGNLAFLRPNYAKVVADYVKQQGF